MHILGGVRHARSRRSQRGSLESKASKEGNSTISNTKCLLNNNYAVC